MNCQRKKWKRNSDHLDQCKIHTTAFLQPYQSYIVLNEGFKLNGNKDGMTIRKANTEYMFDQSIKSGDSELAGIQIEIWNAEMVGICRGYIHAILEHPNGYITNLKAKHLDLSKMEYDKICESCIRGKQCQKNATKRLSSELKNQGT